MSTDNDSDRKRTTLGRPVVGPLPAPPLKSPAALEGKPQGTMRQDHPVWGDDDDDDAGNKTAALDISQIEMLQGKPKAPPPADMSDPDNNERTLAGIPVFDDSGMPAAPKGKATLDQVAAPFARPLPPRPLMAGAPKPVTAKPNVDSEMKTQSAQSPFAGEDSEAKTSIAVSPFAATDDSEAKTSIAASPFAEPEKPDLDTEGKTTVATSPFAEAEKPKPSFRKAGGDDEKTRVAQAPSEDRTRMAGSPFRDMPQGESTMMFDASALLAPRQEGPVGVVTITAGPDSGKEFFLRGESTVVGRGLDCDLVLNDPSVSRRHFRIDKRDANYLMVDLGSGNGTKVDGAKQAEKILDDGMKITVGTTTLQFGFVGSESRAPVEEQVVVKKAGWGLRIAFGLLFLGLVGAGTFYTGEKLGWWRVVTPAVSAEDLAKETGPKPWEAPADQAREALAKKDLAAADAAVKAVAEAGGSKELVAGLTTRIASARKTQTLVAEQKAAIAAGKLQEAMRVLKSVPATSPFYTDADTLLDAARAKLLDAWKDEADTLAGKEDFEGAKAKLNQVLQERPDDEEAKTRLTELADEEKEAIERKAATEAAAKALAEAAAKAAEVAKLAAAQLAAAAVPGAPPGVPAVPGEPGAAAPPGEPTCSPFGSDPLSSASNVSLSTWPERPSAAAPLPNHSPDVSASPGV